jgi:hypothetical protein
MCILSVLGNQKAKRKGAFSGGTYPFESAESFGVIDHMIACTRATSCLFATNKNRQTFKVNCG